jgi:hypothetical protein
MLKKNFVFFLLLVSTLACAEIPADEKAFKNQVTELKELISGYTSIRAKTELIKSYDGKVEGIKAIKIDRKKQERFINKTKEEWIDIHRNLKQFVIEHPDSRWADDAAFCDAIAFGLLIFPGGMFKEERKEAIYLFIERYPNFVLEDWTKKSFSKYIDRSIYQWWPERISGKFSEQEMIRGVLFINIISQYVSEGEIDVARKELIRLGDKGRIDSYFIEEARNIIDLLNKSSETGK